MKTWTPDAIKALRKKLGQTQLEFSKNLGVHKNYVSMLEHGTKIPGKTLQLLLECLESKHPKEAHHGKRNQ